MDITEITNELNKNPSEKNWKRLNSALRKGKVEYYRVFFEKGKLKNTQDLRNSYVKLYDKKKNEMAQVPIFMKNGKEIGGATIYLKGLSILNG